MGTAVEERRVLWLSRVNEWRGSGLSRVAFAQQHGLSVKQLNNWAQRLSKQGNVPALVPVRLKTEMNPSLQLKSASGWTLVLPPDVPARWLSELLRGLA